MLNNTSKLVSGIPVHVIEEATASVCVQLWPHMYINVTSREFTSNGETNATVVCIFPQLI